MQRFLSQDPFYSSAYKAMNIILEEDPQSSRGALWLGDYTAAQDRTTLKAKGIKSVLTVAQGLNITYPKGSEMEHKTYNIQDVETANISKIWLDTYRRIDEGLLKGGVLVHCAAGVSRSASTVIAYIMRKKNKGFSETINFVRSKRPVICPNSGFQRQLKTFERELKYEQQTSPQQVSISPSKEKNNLNYLNQLQQVIVKDTKQILNNTSTPVKTLASQQIQFTPQKINNPLAMRIIQAQIKPSLHAQSPVIRQTKTKQVDFGKGKPFMQNIGTLQQTQQKQSENQIILQQISKLNRSQQQQQPQTLQINTLQRNQR